MLIKLILYFSIIFILSSCFSDVEFEQEKVYNKSEIDSMQRNYVRNLKIDSTIYLDEFKSIYGDNFERYKFDIILDTQLKINNDSIFFPIYINNNNEEDSYYGLWLLNLIENKIETKFHLSKETGAYFNDIFQMKKYNTDKQIILPDTFVHNNSGKLKIINYKTNKLLYEDTLLYDNSEFWNEEFVYFNHPFIYTEIEDTLFVKNIETNNKSKFNYEKNIRIKYYKFLKDSMLLYCYDSLNKKGVIASSNYKKNNFKKLFSFEVSNYDYISNLEIINEKFIITENFEKLYLLDINELKETRILNEEINDYKYIDNRLFILSKKGLYEYSIKNKKTKLLREIDIETGYFEYIKPNLIVWVSSIENPISLIYNTIQNIFVQDINIVKYSQRISDKIFISEDRTAIYILK